MKQMKKEIGEEKDYKYSPSLPEDCFLGQEIYDKASQDEKDIITTALITSYISILRHAKTYMDDLYNPQKREEIMKQFLNFLESTPGYQYKPRFEW
jgi:hypothetical protein